MLTEKLQNSIMEVMRDCGQHMLTAHLQKEQVHTKEGRGNFVTDYDVHNQRMLMDAFSRLLPHAKFLGEEETGDAPSQDLLSGDLFIIDPIDGTTNFLFGYRMSTISVGLARDGEMIAGFVYQPYTDEMYHAVRGQGSFHNGRRVHVLDGGLADGIAAFGCAGYHPADVGSLFRSLQSIFEIAPAIRSCGSAAWDISRIAGACNSCYVEMLLSPWDYAAAKVIVEEAGGVITQLDGTPVSLLTPSSVLAGTQKACQEVRAIFAKQNEKGV